MTNWSLSIISQLQLTLFTVSQLNFAQLLTATQPLKQLSCNMKKMNLIWSQQPCRSIKKINDKEGRYFFKSLFNSGGTSVMVNKRAIPKDCKIKKSKPTFLRHLTSSMILSMDAAFC
jgi:hypothetical protein